MNTNHTLELVFTTANNKTSTITIENPKLPIDLDQVKASMDEIISQSTLTTTSGKLAVRKQVRHVEKNVQEFTV
ncbi:MULTISPECIES: DUF2922 domain-containing protein [Bacillus]|uniref:DUF2922 domain-containing protein n=1 Tax=Bacillus TaxID=1386 RepID=UPI00031921FC|nr:MULTISPECIES: DUF2922 domain-containing protein [Bacillus]